MGLLDALIDKEKATYDTIKDALEDIQEELGCNYGDFIMAIKPTDDKHNFKIYILKTTPEFIAAIPATIVREITVKEIIGD